MKNLFRIPFAMFVACLIFVSCSTEEGDFSEENSTISVENDTRLLNIQNDQISENGNKFLSHDLLLESTFKTGIQEIYYDNDKEEYGFNTYKTTQYSSELFNFSDYKIILDDSFYFRLKSNINYGLKVENGKVYLDSPKYSGLFSNLAIEENRFIQNKEMFIISIFINEFNASDENKAYYDPVDDCGGCPFSNLYDVYGFGSNAGAAQSNLQYNLSNFSQDNCWQVTGPEASGDYGIISIWTQTYCCP